jgi:hypothetical protein
MPRFSGDSNNPADDLMDYADLIQIEYHLTDDELKTLLIQLAAYVQDPNQGIFQLICMKRKGD